MDNRKTRIGKERTNKRIAQQKIELNQLKAQKTQLETKLTMQKAYNSEHLKIRNLRIFKSTCNLLIPFVISAGVIVGAGKVIADGLPFYVDEITKYKTYSMEYQSDAFVTLDEQYKKFSTAESSLVVYTPWELENDKYVREKREYDLDGFNNLELFDAVLKEDYDHLLELIKNYEYKLERQTINSIDEEKKDYYFEASLNMIDKEDTLTYRESDSINLGGSYAELILILLFGCLFTIIREFDYLEEIRKINSTYRHSRKDLEPIKQEIQQLNQKILSLSQGKRR